VAIWLDNYSGLCCVCSHGDGVVIMADEAENLVLTLLREMRGQLKSVQAQLDKIESDDKIGKIQKTLDTLTFQMTHTFGLAGLSHLTSRQNADAIAELQAWQSTAEAALRELRTPPARS
jgi:hypothetical protein